jgi:hypothetical protein
MSGGFSDRQESGTGTKPSVAVWAAVFVPLTNRNRSEFHTRSSLNTTGLSPSVQQFIETPFSLNQGRFPPNDKVLIVGKIVCQAEVQKPSGIFPSSSTRNSCPSKKSSHAPSGWPGVAGLLLKTSDGWNLLSMVIFTLLLSTNLDPLCFVCQR